MDGPVCGSIVSNVVLVTVSVSIVKCTATFVSILDVYGLVAAECAWALKHSNSRYLNGGVRYRPAKGVFMADICPVVQFAFKHKLVSVWVLVWIYLITILNLRCHCVVIKPKPPLLIQPFYDELRVRGVWLGNCMLGNCMQL